MPLKIATWNVDGYSKLVEAELKTFLLPDCDVVCLQEIKRAQRPVDIPGYTWFWNPARGKPHLWGTGMLVRSELEPTLVGAAGVAFADEGRVLTVRLGKHDTTVVCVYVPNSGVGKNPLRRLEERTTVWDPSFRRYVDTVGGGTVVVCGDLNVASRDVDVHNPKGLRRKAGFTDEERESFRKGLGDGELVDAWTALHGDAPGFTFWGRYPGIKENDKGWRLDYQLSRGTLKPTAAEIHRDQEASDHVPLVVDYVWTPDGHDAPAVCNPSHP